MIDWILANREWIFSGAGVAFIGVVISLIVKNRKKHISQDIKSATGSHIIQAGHEVNINFITNHQVNNSPSQLSGVLEARNVFLIGYDINNLSTLATAIAMYDLESGPAIDEYKKLRNILIDEGNNYGVVLSPPESLSGLSDSDVPVLFNKIISKFQNELESNNIELLAPFETGNWLGSVVAVISVVIKVSPEHASKLLNLLLTKYIKAHDGLSYLGANEQLIRDFVGIKDALIFLSKKGNITIEDRDQITDSVCQITQKLGER